MTVENLVYKELGAGALLTATFHLTISGLSLSPPTANPVMAKLVIMPIAAVLVLLFAGVAQATCAAGYKDCDKNYSKNGCEVNVDTDVNNCGDCGIKCSALCGVNAIPVCKAAKCEFSCTAPFQNCDSDWKNGCEVDVSKDVNNCGACGTKCIAPLNAIATCNDHKCEYTCKPGYNNCDNDWSNGCEATCGSDANNCGACGNKCEDVANAVTKCNGGKCEYTCKPGYNNCDGDWKNGCEGSCGSDVDHCGACGNKCKEVPYAVTKCYGGKCEYFCRPGHANCDGDWKNGCECQPGTDVNNCGGCGKKCPLPKYAGGEAKCTYGKCETQSCKRGWNWENKKRCCVKKCFLLVCW